MSTGRTYTVQELVALQQEYLLTLPDDNDGDWYSTSRGFATVEITGFIGWLNIKEHTP